MDLELICNFKKCRKSLTTGIAWVTSCSHIFCDEDGTREFEKAFICPACDTRLLRNSRDIVRVDLDPSDDYKAMVLAGHKPETVMEVCSRALGFWAFQINQEMMYQKHIGAKAKEKIAELEQYYDQVLQKIKKELGAVKRQMEAAKDELETYKKRYAEIHEKIAEKKRQNERLRSKYESLKRKALPPQYWENEDHLERSSCVASNSNNHANHTIRQASYLPTADEVFLRPMNPPASIGAHSRGLNPKRSSENFVFKPVFSEGRQNNCNNSRERSHGDELAFTTLCDSVTESTENLHGFTSIRNNSGRK